MRELELLLKLADSTEILFLRDLLRDMRQRFGPEETLAIIDDACCKLSEETSGPVKDLIKEVQQQRDSLMIRGEYEKWNEAARQQQEQEQKPWASDPEQWKFGPVAQKKGWEW